MRAQTFAFLGASALPDIANKMGKRRMAALQKDAPLVARHAYFVHWDGKLDIDSRAVLSQLLAATEAFPAAADTRALIIPHFGVASPWSSKAGDIFHRCRLHRLLRIERGVLLQHRDMACPDFLPAEEIADKMTQTVLRGKKINRWRHLFAAAAPKPPMRLTAEAAMLQKYNREWGLSLADNEIAHLSKVYQKLRRAPTEAEILMFAQANSEHCRHKIFNSPWRDGGDSLMDAIRQTHAAHPAGVVTAFDDNAAVLEGGPGMVFAPGEDDVYRRRREIMHLVAKAETHNHPTAICPFPGAATGCGGEIRDEAAAGRGAASRAGFCGFAVSHLGLEECGAMPAAGDALVQMASPLQIMMDAPLGAAAFGNEFGRPLLAGFFRCFESSVGGVYYGFHKPIMLAGGLGQMRPQSVGKRPLPPGTKIIHLGGPGFRIGMGGGSASSRAGDERLDWASVQRDNAEMQRRAQQVLETCRHLPDGGMLLSLHDVGAGGVANAVIEMVDAAGRGAEIRLRDIPVQDGSLSPAEIWCNESQERYVLACAPRQVEEFAAICARECCPFAVLGEVTKRRRIVVVDGRQKVTDLPLAAVLGKLPLPPRGAPAKSPPLSPSSLPASPPRLSLAEGEVREALYSVLRHPSVGGKNFLITIGDRTVGGLTARDQLVGPWQTPAADCAAFFNDYDGFGGAVFALGEKSPLAAVNPAAGARMAIAEALTNLGGGDVASLGRIKLSLNWMANCGDDEREMALREAVLAAAHFCRQLGIGVVVGKDSLSMRAPTAGGEVQSPPMAVAAAFAAVPDARRCLTPQLDPGGDSFLLLATMSGRRRLGQSVFCQVSGRTAADEIPDVEAASMQNLWRALAACRARNLLLAYHDVSDGGLWAAVCEMCFAANCGAVLTLDNLAGGFTDTDHSVAAGVEELPKLLFNEEIAVLLQASAQDAAAVMDIFTQHGLGECIQSIGYPTAKRRIAAHFGGRKVADEPVRDLRRAWMRAGYEIARRRDNENSAEAEWRRDYENDDGLFVDLPFAWDGEPPAVGKRRPRAAIVREQGTNGHREMAAAFDGAGFEAVDVTVGDLLRGRRRLDDFQLLTLCGGFSFGDVLGAGRGLAASVLHNEVLAEMFARFFQRPHTLSLGVCNGCQALAAMRRLMPDAEAWRFPQFAANLSGRFEARLVMAEVRPSPSVLLGDMAGARLPIVCSHGEGRRVFDDEAAARAPATMRFIDHRGAATEQYPFNPNGSPGGETGFCSPDGRINILMPHPERVFRTAQFSWYPRGGGEFSPWMKMFLNARRFLR